LEVTANNIANANTPGFKRESVFEKNLIDASAHLNDTPGDAKQSDPPMGSYVDFAKGMFQQTDNPLDLAIDNKNGFFVVQDEAGKEFYTRAGHFILSPGGEITTMDGKKISGVEGSVGLGQSFTVESSKLTQNNSVTIKISGNGEIFVNAQHAGFMQVASIENPETLQKVSNQCFLPTDSTKVEYMPQEEVSVKQGWLENSNVDIVKEMVQMIELQRMFEVGSKVIHTNTETIDQSLRLGRIA
jgi:flagellar basal-body rod protein FlgF